MKYLNDLDRTVSDCSIRAKLLSLTFLMAVCVCVGVCPGVCVSVFACNRNVHLKICCFPHIAKYTVDTTLTAIPS